MKPTTPQQQQQLQTQIHEGNIPQQQGQQKNFRPFNNNYHHQKPYYNQNRPPYFRDERHVNGI